MTCSKSNFGGWTLFHVGCMGRKRTRGLVSGLYVGPQGGRTTSGFNESNGDVTVSGGNSQRLGREFNQSKILFGLFTPCNHHATLPVVPPAPFGHPPHPPLVYPPLPVPLRAPLPKRAQRTPPPPPVLTAPAPPARRGGSRDPPAPRECRESTRRGRATCSHSPAGSAGGGAAGVPFPHSLPRGGRGPRPDSRCIVRDPV